MMKRSGPRASIAVAAALSAFLTSEAPLSADSAAGVCPETGHLLAVASRTDHGVRFVDPSAGSVVAVVSTGPGPHELALSPEGELLYVANMGVYPVSAAYGRVRFERDEANTVSVVDLASGRVSANHELTGYTRPHGIDVSGDGKRLWVTAEEQSSVLEIDAKRGTVIERWRTPQPAHMVLAGPGGEIYAAATGGAAVMVIDRRTGTVREIPTGAGPEGMALRPGTTELWVANRVANSISIIDTDLHSVIETVPAGGEFSLKLAFSPDGATAWVSNNRSGTVTVLDAETRRLVDAIDLGTAPLGIAVAPTGSVVAVTTPRTGEVVLLDAERRTIRCRISVGKDADGVAWIPRAGPWNRQDVEGSAYRDAAREIGSWLRSLEVGGASAPDDALRPEASSSLAEGAAGIALFLHELDLATEDPRRERAASEMADRLIGLLPAAMAREGFPPRTSLYYGAPGLATVLLRLHETTWERRHLDAVRGVVAWLLAQRAPDPARWTGFNDVLFGDSGTALFLLDAADALDDAAARERAAAVGRSLLTLARRDAAGLHWVLREGASSNLPNFSHGTAGVGYLLGRLYEKTGDEAFLEGALGAAEYLGSIARVEQGRLAIPYGMDRPEWRERYELGWGHGISGSARFFELLARITKDPDWVKSVERAGEAVLAAELPGAYPLDRRFGLAGIADFGLDLFADGRDTEQTLALVRRLADHLIARGVRERAGLHWEGPRPAFMSAPGEPGALTGYLHGAAGIGLLFLRLDAVIRGVPWTFRLPDTPW